MPILKRPIARIVAWLLLAQWAWCQQPDTLRISSAPPTENRGGVDGSSIPGASGLPISPSPKQSENIPQLQQHITIDLRDVTLLEALFAIRDLAGINLVVGNEITGAVNAAFEDAPVQEVLDSLLLPRGYGYRIVSGSIVVMRLENLGSQLPQFTTRIIPLRWNDADQLVNIAESLLSPQGRIHAVPGSNSLVVMDYADRIPPIVNQIETLEQAAREFQLAKQQEAEQEAQKQMEAAQSTKESPISATQAPAPDLSSLPSSATTTDATSTSQRPPTYVRVFSVQYVEPTVLITALQPLLSSNGSLTALDKENKIVALDTKENLERIDAAIQQLDFPRQQVRIWARIYDCSIEDLRSLGVNFSSRVNGANMTADGDPNHSITLDAVTATLTGPTRGHLTLSTINRLGTVESIFQALESADDSRLLADPNVVVMNHEEARINIVTEVPYQQLTQGLNGGEIGTTSFREAGVQLTVTPHIASDDTVTMVINPTFSLLTGFTEGDNAPIIDRRDTKTTVRVANLETIVLGGLRQRTRTVTKRGIPGLSRIPYLGHLFRFRDEDVRESELLVFITPEIVAPDYPGTPREQCYAEQLHVASEMTPTAPIPFGHEAVVAERLAERQCINSCPHTRLRNPLVIRRSDGTCSSPQCVLCEDGLPGNDPTPVPAPEIIGGLDVIVPANNGSPSREFEQPDHSKP